MWGRFPQDRAVIGEGRAWRISLPRLRYVAGDFQRQQLGHLPFDDPAVHQSLQGLSTNEKPGSAAAGLIRKYEQVIR